jgi:hypothetical protein
MNKKKVLERSRRSGFHISEQSDFDQCTDNGARLRGTRRATRGVSRGSAGYAFVVGRGETVGTLSNTRRLIRMKTSEIMSKQKNCYKQNQHTSSSNRL